MPTKHIHRIPVPEEFIEPIGEAVCVSQYLDTCLLNIGRRLDASFYEKNMGETSGPLTDNLKKLSLKEGNNTPLREEIKQLCCEAKKIFKRRNEIVHSRGYTTNQGDQSRLYRRKMSDKTQYYDPPQIRKFVEEAAALACEANALLDDIRMPKN